MINERPLFGRVDIEHVTNTLAITSTNTRGGTLSTATVTSVGTAGDRPPVSTCSKIAWTATPTASPASWAWGSGSTQALRGVPGETITLSVYVFASFTPGNGFRIDISAYDAAGAAISTPTGPHTITTVNRWVRLSRTITLPAGTATFRPSVSFSGPNIPEAVGQFAALTAFQIDNSDTVRKFVPSGVDTGARRVSYFGAKTSSLNITRGGVRSGLGITTDVGLCTFTLENHLDPLQGEFIMPGETVRVVAGITPRTIQHMTKRVYSWGFESYKAINHKEVGHWEPTPPVITGWTPGASVYSHDFNNLGEIVTPGAGVVLSEDFSQGMDAWTIRNFEGGTAEVVPSGGPDDAAYIRGDGYAWAKRSFDPIIPVGNWYRLALHYRKVSGEYASISTEDGSPLLGYGDEPGVWDTRDGIEKAYSNLTYLELDLSNGEFTGITVEDIGTRDTDLGGWVYSGSGWSTADLDEKNLYITRGRASRAITGLTVGTRYRVSADVVEGWPGTGTEAEITINGASGTSVVPTSTPQRISYDFTATTTSHTVELITPSPGPTAWDNISVIALTPVYTEQPDHWVVDTPAWVEVLNDGFDGWAANVTKRWCAAPALAGNLSMYATGNGDHTKVITGFQIGHPYRITARVDGGISTANAQVGVSGKGVSATANPSTGAQTISYSFTATSTAHTMILRQNTSTSVPIRWDSIEISRTSWTEEITTAAQPIFTGRVLDTEASYPLNKNTGVFRSRLNVTVADAVQVHATTPRYGVQLPSPYYETFEARIARLNGSAQAPIIVPTVGAPREVYSL